MAVLNLDKQELQDSYVVFKNLVTSGITKDLEQAGAIMASNGQDNAKIEAAAEQCKKFQALYNGGFLSYVNVVIDHFNTLTDAADLLSTSNGIGEVTASDIDYKGHKIDLSGLN